MLRSRTSLYVALAAVLALSAGFAAARGHGGGKEGRDQLVAMDSDGNRAISALEADAYFTARAEKIDANKDGAITEAEVKAFHETEREARRAARFAALDTNADGRVSTDEFAQSRIDFVMKRDADGDGEVAAGEGRRGHRGRGQ